MQVTYIRKPAVAGLFYPDKESVLSAMVDGLLSCAQPSADAGAPKALIAPHAGYTFSGPIAASAYASLYHSSSHVNRVVLIGPSHRVGFSGLAFSGADGFATPLGVVPVDKGSVHEGLKMPQTNIIEEAHLSEHSLETQLPFLQRVLGEFNLVPIAAGHIKPDYAARILEALWGDDDTLIVVSSDLSHYHDYETAVRMDERTACTIEKLGEIEPKQACGCVGINGLLVALKHRKLAMKAVDIRNSGDTAGPRDRVVGYGAFISVGAN